MPSVYGEAGNLEFIPFLLLDCIEFLVSFETEGVAELSFLAQVVPHVQFAIHDNL